MAKTDDKEPRVCPYCEEPVVEVSTRGRYVNGLKPVRGKGCEFCNPTPRRQSARAAGLADDTPDGQNG